MKQKVLSLMTLALVLGVVTFSTIKVEAAGAVKLNKKKVVLTSEQTCQLKLKNTEKKVKWSTSDKDVVKVNKQGNLTAVGMGNAKVTAKVSGKKYTCKVTVADYSGMSNEQKAVVSYALKYVGNKYSYGGSSLTKGTDCSGFTMAVYKKFGYKLTHNAYSQIGETKKVKLKNIKPGDLVFYGYSKRSCNHVALYIGNQKVVHASNPINGILVSDYDYRKIVAVGRVLKTETYPEDETPDDSTTEETNPERMIPEEKSTEDTVTPDDNGDVTKMAVSK